MNTEVGKLWGWFEEDLLCDDNISEDHAVEEHSPELIQEYRTPFCTPRTPRENRRLNKVDDRTETAARSRKQFVLDDLLAGLKRQELDAISEEFHNRGASVSLSEFIHIIRQHRHMRYDQETLLQLAGLFDEIDIDGDKDLTFEEFTSYLVQQSLDSDDVTRQYEPGSLALLDERPGGGADTALPRKNVAPTGAGAYAPTAGEQVDFLKYFPELDRVVVCQPSHPQHVVRLYRPHISVQPELRLTKVLRGHQGPCICATYLPSLEFMVTSGADRRLLFWDIQNGYRCRCATLLSTPVISLTAHKNHLITGSVSGMLRGYSVNTGFNTEFALGNNEIDTTSIEIDAEGTFLSPLWRVEAHKDMATCCQGISDSIIASCGLDSNICLWDIGGGSAKYLNTLEGHVKGVFSLAFHPELRFLVSVGSDRDALVWNPWNRHSHPVGRLRGHHTSLVSCELLPNSTQLLTADISGCLALWDLRTYEKIQQFSLSPDQKPRKRGQALSGFSSCGTHRMVIAANTQLYCFLYDNPVSSWLSHEGGIRTVIYNSVTSTILTACGTDVKIWDVKTGLVLRSFKNISQSEISCVTLDSQQRKIIIGDCEGRITIHNYLNGALMKICSPPHSSVVSGLISTPTGQLVSASWDGTIALHSNLELSAKTSNQNSRKNLPTLDVSVTAEGKNDIVCLKYSPVFQCFATVHNDACVRIWSLVLGSAGTEFKRKSSFSQDSIHKQFRSHQSPITCICLLDPFPVIVSCDENGWFILWLYRPISIQGQIIYRWRNFFDGEKTSTINVMHFDSTTKFLYTGDENGEIRIWQMGNFLAHSNILSPVAQSFKIPKLTGYESRTWKEYSILDPLFAPFIYSKWEAHSGAVTFLNLYRQPEVLLSSSKDGRARAWSLSGEYLGTLRQARTGGTWNFPDDSENRFAVKQRLANAIFDSIKEDKEDPYHITMLQTTLGDHRSVKPEIKEKETTTWGSTKNVGRALERAEREKMWELGRCSPRPNISPRPNTSPRPSTASPRIRTSFSRSNISPRPNTASPCQSTSSPRPRTSPFTRKIFSPIVTPNTPHQSNKTTPKFTQKYNNITSRFRE